MIWSSWCARWLLASRPRRALLARRSRRSGEAARAALLFSCMPLAFGMSRLFSPDMAAGALGLSAPIGSVVFYVGGTEMAYGSLILGLRLGWYGCGEV